MRQAKKPKRVSEAPESNAGDDYHILWTVRRSLCLLNLKDNKVKAIHVEGPSPAESNKLDEFGDKLLGIDVTEYTGGEDFRGASRVTFSQVKYSTRNESEPWSAARLCKGKKKGSKGSLVDRLASIYKTYLKEFEQEQVSAKLVIKLVSNQAASASLKQLMKDFAQAILAPVLMDAVKKGDDYQRIKNASELDETDFHNFLNVLDLSDCGTLNRQQQKDLIDLEIARINFTDSADQYNRLHLMVWNKMQPESREKNKITKEDVLHCFKCNAMEELFPVPASFEPAPFIIEREQTRQIADLIVSSRENICLHAGAGMGKSTLARTLPEYLPEGSLAIVFDCYGGGSYSFASDKRHKHEWALTQICNELAVIAGTPLLLNWRQPPEVYIREFKKRLQRCAEVLTKKNDTALLVIIIDAADNSITAAMADSRKSFVLDLVGENYPDRCRIVLTSRTEQVDSLKLTGKWKTFEINRFSLPETTLYLHHYFPDADSDKIVEFHGLTRAIPRVQSYALEDTDASLEQILSPLKPNGKELEEIMQRRIEVAALRSGEPEKLKRILTLLVTLPRPVPAEYLVGLADCSQQLLDDLSIDLWKGIVSEHGQFYFRDEDYETFLKRVYASDETTNGTIAAFFLSRAASDEYASMFVAAMLIAAGRYRALYDIVVERKYLVYPIDPVRNRELYIERAMLAMKYSGDITDDPLTFQKLQIIAAEESKTDKVLKDILIENAELTAIYGDIKTVQKIYFQSEENTWAGPVHFKSAAVFSRNPQSGDLAKKHLKSAESWIDWRGRLPEEELYHYSLSFFDLGFGAEAYLRLYGLADTIYWCRRWKSRERMLGVVNNLISTILAATDGEQVQLWLSEAFVRTDVRALVCYHCIRQGIKPFFDVAGVLKDAASMMRRVKAIPTDFYSILIGLVEYGGRNNLETATLVEELKRLQPALPQHILRFQDNEYDTPERGNIDTHLRMLCREAIASGNSVQPKTLYSHKLKTGLSSTDKKLAARANEDKAEADKIYGRAIEFYMMRAAFLMSRDDEMVFFERIGTFSKAIKNDYQFNSYLRHHADKAYNFFAGKLLDLLVSVQNKEQFLKIIREHFFYIGSSYESDNNITLRLLLAGRAAAVKQCHALAAVELYDVEMILQHSTMPGPSKIEYYVRLTSIANEMDQKLGRYYFDKIIAAASDIDMSALDRINCISTIFSGPLPVPDPQLAYRFADYIEYCRERLGDAEHFPWDNALKGIANLDTASGFATLCRWDHKNILKFESSSLVVLMAALENKYLDVITVSAMLPVYRYYDETYDQAMDTLLAAFNAGRLTRGKNLFLKHLIRDIRLCCPGYRAKTLVTKVAGLIVKDLSVEADIAAEFREYLSFLQELNNDREDDDRYNTKPDKHSVSLVDISGINPTDARSVEKALASISDGSDRFSPRTEIDTLLQALQNIAVPADYTAHLDALIDLPEEMITFWSLEDALETRFESWGYYFEVREWKKKSFAKVLKLRLNHFIRDERMYVTGFRKFAALFGMGDAEIATIIQNLIPEIIETLSGTVLFELLQFTSSANSADQDKSLAEWALERWTKDINHKLSDGPWTENLLPPATAAETAGYTIRYLLGHSHKGNRWRAAHAVIRLVEAGKPEMLSFLLEKENEQHCLVFQYRGYPFFWMSAQLWLWVILTKLVERFPDAISFLNRAMITSTVNLKLEHALIIYFRKAACLKLFELYPAVFRGTEVEQIRDMLVSKLEHQKRKSRPYNGMEQRPEREKLVFTFDSLDTLPYWYQPLGGLFGIGSHEIAKMADQVITTTWGYRGNIHRDNHVNKESHYGRSKDHGDVPEVEDLQTYYEYHAMFCVAAELIKNKPLVKDPDDERDLIEWLLKYGLAWDHHWISELRDATPLKQRFWHSSIREENWQTSIAVDEFEKQLEIKNTAADFFAIKGSYETYEGKDHESFYFSSALVSAKTAPALLNALQTETNSHDYAIPAEDDTERHQINSKPFVLKPWLKGTAYENHGLDADDPYAKSWQKHGLGFGRDFCRWLDVKASGDRRVYYRNNNPQDIVGRFETWSDVTGDRSYGQFECEGKRLKVKKKILLDYLKYKSCSLIIKCTVSKWKDGGRESMGSFKESVKIFLIESNGTIKSFSGSHQLG